MAQLPSELLDPVRLEAVQSSGLLDTGPEEAFDGLATLAATLLEAPLAFVTVVDTERSWFAAAVGLPPDADRQTPVDESFCQYVIGSSRPLIVKDARRDPRTRDNPALDTMGVAAWAGFPVRAASGEVLGTFCVVDRVPREWTERDVQVLRTLARAASNEIALRMALDNERKARASAEAAATEAARLASVLRESGQRSATLADTLRQSLLPPSLPEVPGLELAARYRPAASGDDVVGDFYDVFQASRSSWGVVVGDVSGKGPQAATLTALARYTLRAAAARTHAPKSALQILNRALLQEQVEDERFLTVVYARLQRVRAGVAMSVCSAGHLPPLLVRADGTVEEVTEPGMPLGLFPAPSLTTTRLTLLPGDSLLLYTDGVTEARGGAEELGGARLRAVAARTAGLPAADAAARVEDAVTAFRDGPPKDDTAILVLRVPDDAGTTALAAAVPLRGSASGKGSS